MSVLAVAPAYAAETTSVQLRKKFKLHQVRIEYKHPGMSGFWPIRNANQNPGVITADDLTFQPALFPPLSLEESRYTWNSDAFWLPIGQGRINAIFALPGSRDVSLSVLDKNHNAQRSFTALTRIRHVGFETEPDICPLPPDFPAVEDVGNCLAAATDAGLANLWSRSEDVGEALGFGRVSCTRDDGRCNAVKHAYWNLLMVRDTDLAFATRLATAHERLSTELTGINAGGAHNASVMDLDNNNQGRIIGDAMRETFTTSLPFGDAQGEFLILNAFNNGYLTRLDTSGLPTVNTDGTNPEGKGLLEPANTPNPQ